MNKYKENLLRMRMKQNLQEVENAQRQERANARLLAAQQSTVPIPAPQGTSGQADLTPVEKWQKDLLARNRFLLARVIRLESKIIDKIAITQALKEAASLDQEEAARLAQQDSVQTGGGTSGLSVDLTKRPSSSLVGMISQPEFSNLTSPGEKPEAGKNSIVFNGEMEFAPMKQNPSSFNDNSAANSNQNDGSNQRLNSSFAITFSVLGLALLVILGILVVKKRRVRLRNSKLPMNIKEILSQTMSPCTSCSYCAVYNSEPQSLEVKSREIGITRPENIKP